MELSIVTTMFYSQDYLAEFYDRIKTSVDKLNITYEIIFIDDGSPDQSLIRALQLQERDEHVKVIELSRNFGHQKAIMTGLNNSSGNFIFLIDCDLEEDPELLLTFWERMKTESQIDVVYGVQIKRKGGWFERLSGRLFYRMVSFLANVDYPADTLTARLMTRKYVNSVKLFLEKELDLWGVFSLTGFSQIPVQAIKKYKGSSTFTLRKKISRTVEVITSISHKPLYFTFILGFFSFLIALINIGVIIYKRFYLNEIVEGWASTVASIWFVGGMILLVLGIFGIYLSKMFLEIKNRPLTIIKKIYAK